MAFVKTTWEDYPSTATKVTASELNRIENGIEEAENMSAISTDANNSLIRGVDDGLFVPKIPNLLADLTEDATHRVVTDTEKNTWNGKQDAITSSNKLSYDLISGTPTIPSELADLTDDATHRLVTDTEKSTWNGKMDPVTLAAVATSGSYTDLSNKPTIPSLSDAYGTSNEYSDYFGYSEGDYRLYNNKLYLCYRDTDAGIKPTNTNYWKEINLSELNSNLNSYWTTIERVKKVSAVANTFVLGMTITIPARTYFVIEVNAAYDACEGNGVIISRGNSTTNPWSVMAKSDGYARCSYSGFNYRTTAETLYCFGRWASNGPNNMYVNGFYHTIE